MLEIGWRREVFVMKNLFEAGTAKEITERIGRLCPTSQRQWGKMTAPQAMAHCSVGMEWAVCDSVAPRMFVGRILGPMVKSQLLKDERPMARNSPTAKSLVVKDERDLGKECTRLSANITPDEWAQLMYKHVDHHLRQFGV
jgi:hypothetical protein